MRKSHRPNWNVSNVNCESLNGITIERDDVSIAYHALGYDYEIAGPGYSYASGQMAANTRIGSYRINANGVWVR